MRQKITRIKIQKVQIFLLYRRSSSSLPVASEAKKLADSGNAMVQCLVGYLYVNELDVSGNYQTGVTYLPKASLQNSSDAHYELARKCSVIVSLPSTIPLPFNSFIPFPM